MKYFKSFMFGYGISILASVVPVQAMDKPSKPLSEDVFAQVNHVPLSLDLYHFLVSSRTEQHEEMQTFDENFDPELTRQQTIKDLVMTELLAQQAVKEGMDLHAQVRIEMEMARKTLLAQLYVQQLMQTIQIDEASIRDYYNNKAATSMYRFMIWRTQDQQQASLFLKSLKSEGESEPEFSALNASAMETPWLRDVDIDPQVNALVTKLEAGSYVETPIFQDGFWKVIKVLDKEIHEKQPFEDERHIIRSELMQTKLDQKLEALAKQATIIFNELHVKEIN